MNLKIDIDLLPRSPRRGTFRSGRGANGRREKESPWRKPSPIIPRSTSPTTRFRTFTRSSLRRDRAVAPIRYHGAIAYLITRFRDLQAAFADDDTFPSWAAYQRHSGPVMGKTIQCMGGDEHRRNRALVSKAFRPQLMKEFVEAFLTPVAHQLVDEFVDRGKTDLVRDYITRYAFTVITRLPDFPPTDFEQLKAWGDGLINYPWDPEGATEASRSFTAYLRPVLDERRTNPGEDLLSSLVTVEVDGEQLTDDEVYNFIRLLFPAGADTTYRGLGSMMYAVLRHRDVFVAIQDDPGLVPQVVLEALRWEPPTAMLPRFAPKDVTWAGHDIPGGSEVIFGITSANRDTGVFEEPERFNPWRKERELVTFGHGLHFCLGSHLARREMEVSLSVLSQRLPSLELVDPEEVCISGTVLRGPKSLPVRFAAH
jgi:cytochrome P450